MKKLIHPFDISNFNAQIIRDYLGNDDFLKPFYDYRPNIDEFEKVIEQRKNFPVNRTVLNDVLTEQNSLFFNQYPLVEKNCHDLLHENTFTITTGHQLCLLSGPLYFIYKIITTINTTEQLKAKYPNFNFVPVFWMASEDHDIEEIGTVNFPSKKYKWNVNEKGSTGRLSTASLSPMLDQILHDNALFPFVSELQKIIDQSYFKSSNLAQATRAFVYSLFGKYGVVVIDADHASLKKSVVHFLKDELEQQPTFKLLNGTNDSLSEKYPLQIQPRAINLFYLDNGLREKIVQAPDGHYEVVNTDLMFRKHVLIDVLESKPEMFSPNVALRPVYQELILPNLAYVGGPGEIAYWLQLKSTFEHFKAFYPMLMLRNQAVVISEKHFLKFNQLNLDLALLFGDEETIIQKVTAVLDTAEFNFDEIKESIDKLFETINAELKRIDNTLSSSVMAEKQKSLNSVDQLEKKRSSAIRKKNDVVMNAVKSLFEQTMPSNQPQERYLNLFSFYLKHGPEFIEDLKNELVPFDHKLTILFE